MNAASLRFFTTRIEIWFPLPSVFPLTKPPGLLIMSQIVTMSSSNRLARVHGESIPWSSTSFIATVWLKPSLRNISSITSTMVMVGFLQLVCKMQTVLHLLLLFVGSTYRLFILLYIMVVTIWKIRDLLSVSLVITSMWWAHRICTPFWSLPHFIYQLCNKSTGNSIPGNTICICKVLWAMVSLDNLATCSIVDTIFLIVHYLQKCNSWQNNLPLCYLQLTSEF